MSLPRRHSRDVRVACVVLWWRDVSRKDVHGVTKQPNVGPLELLWTGVAPFTARQKSQIGDKGSWELWGR